MELNLFRKRIASLEHLSYILRPHCRLCSSACPQRSRKMNSSRPFVCAPLQILPGYVSSWWLYQLWRWISVRHSEYQELMYFGIATGYSIVSSSRFSCISWSSVTGYTNTGRRRAMKNNIRVERARLRISQQELADAIGVTRQTIYAIENDKFIPSTELALRMSAYFGKTVNDLFSL